MSHQASLSRADAAGRRWYQDRWPWFLIAGPALVVVASFVTLGLAIKSNDGVVADDYYKLGLVVNRRIAENGPDVHADAGAIINADADGRLRVRLEGFLAPPAQVRLAVSPTGTGQHETVVALVSDAPGSWVGVLPPQSPGRHILRLEADNWSLPITTVAGRITDVRLGAAAQRP